MPWPESDVQPPGSEPVDAISLVKIDFETVDGVVAKYWDVSHADDLEVRGRRDEVAAEVCRRVREHLALERAFVHAVEGSVADEGLLREMRAGQARALELVASIEQGGPNELQRDAAVRVLGDFLLKHAAGEREGVFKHVAASRLNLFDLADQLRARRADGALGDGDGGAGAVAPQRLPEVTGSVPTAR
jgi:hypothetical protein